MVDFEPNENTVDVMFSVYDIQGGRVKEKDRLGSAAVVLDWTQIERRNGRKMLYPLTNTGNSTLNNNLKRLGSVLGLECRTVVKSMTAKKSKSGESVDKPPLAVDLQRMINHGQTLVLWRPAGVEEPIKQSIFFRELPDSSNALFWCQSGKRIKKSSQVLSLDSRMEVRLGKQTTSFQQPASEKIPDDYCFSLVTDVASLDLEASSVKQRDAWVLGLLSITTLSPYPRTLTLRNTSDRSSPQASEISVGSRGSLDSTASRRLAVHHVLPDRDKKGGADNTPDETFRQLDAFEDEDVADAPTSEIQTPDNNSQIGGRTVSDFHVEETKSELRRQDEVANMDGPKVQISLRCVGLFPINPEKALSAVVGVF